MREATQSMNYISGVTEEPHRQRQDGSMLRQPVFDLKAPDGYVELLNFEMEVASIVQMKAYDLSYEEEVPIIKNLARVRQAAVHIDFY